MKSYAIAVVAGALATTVAGTPATPVQKRADVTTITVKGNGAFAGKQRTSTQDVVLTYSQLSGRVASASTSVVLTTSPVVHLMRRTPSPM
jgi:hypothetical protein